MSWTPVNLSEVCVPQSNLTACSPFGQTYLNLLVLLYSDTKDRRIQEKIRINIGNENNNTNVANNITADTKNVTIDYENEEYDFVIVGAGSAGSIVANRLSAIGQWSVLVIEAGNDEPDIALVPGLCFATAGSTIDWGYKTQCNGKSCLTGGCNWPRGKVMGGSSSTNSYAYVRGNKLDYDAWANLGNVGWSYNEVLPYFKKSENNLEIEKLDPKYHGTKGEQPISTFPYKDKAAEMLLQAFNELGVPTIDFNGPNQEGAMISQCITKDGKRVSTNTAFIEPIRYKRKNLTVRTNSEVTKVLINKRKKAYGVKYVNNGTVRIAKAKKEVIVSGGVINSPKLLLLSGIGPKKHLEDLKIEVIKDLPVGQNLHDHPTFIGIVIGLSNTTDTAVTQNEILKQTRQYKMAKTKSGPLSGNGPIPFLAFVKSNPELPAPDIQYSVGSVFWKEYINDPNGYNSLRIFPNSAYDSLECRAMNLIPQSRGELLLNVSNPNGHPLIYPNYLDVKSDVDRLLQGIKNFLPLENTNVFKSKGARFIRIPFPACKQFIWGTDEYFTCLIRNYTANTHHPVGTCKMGPKSDKGAVVDPRLKVYGVFRLRVIDAAVMPIVPRGNTNAPSMMIGEKGAAMIIEDWLIKNQINKRTTSK